MKLKGQVIPAPAPVKIKFYRGKDVFELNIASILDYTEFDKIVPLPKPPLVSKISTGSQYQDYNDIRYRVKFEEYVQQKSNYAVIKGLQATEGLEWGTVRIEEPDTWKNIQDDLRTCFTEGEIVDIMEGVREANNPTEAKQKEAFDSFFATQEQEKGSLFQEGEQQGMQSGVPASDLK